MGIEIGREERNYLIRGKDYIGDEANQSTIDSLGRGGKFKGRMMKMGMT